jgi:hypothetical protein
MEACPFPSFLMPSPGGLNWEALKHAFLGYAQDPKRIAAEDTSTP